MYLKKDIFTAILGISLITVGIIYNFSNIINQVNAKTIDIKENESNYSIINTI